MLRGEGEDRETFERLCVAAGTGKSRPRTNTVESTGGILATGVFVVKPRWPLPSLTELVCVPSFNTAYSPS